LVREYTLHGLDCANCAAKIESAASKLEGVKTASLSFVTTTLRVEVEDGHSEDIQKTIEDTVHKYEPQILVYERTGREQAKGREHDAAGRMKKIRLIAGAAAFAAGLLLGSIGGSREYIPAAVLVFAYLLLGGDIVFRALKNIVRGKVFDENFLMSAATIGAFAIGEYAEGVGVMLFYQTGEFFQDMAVRKSKKSIAGLMDIRPDYANIKRGGNIVKVSPEDVNIGDVIVVTPGEKIPLDGVVTEGSAMLDTTALTGESAPRRASVSDTVLSGCLNMDGVLTIEVTQTSGESTAAKIIDLVENAANKKAPTENFITKFARYYTPAVVALAVLIAVIPPLIDGGLWSEWIRRGLIFLVISCPCALVISIPLGFFGGIGCASKNGVLIKGGNYLEALHNLDMVVFDKTGTLTKGVFKVTAKEPAVGFDADALLELAATAEAYSSHPIALSVMREYGKIIDKQNLADYGEIAGYGITVSQNGRTILAGNQKLMEKTGIAFEESKSVGTKVYVAVDGTYAGCVVISDEIKEDSQSAVSGLKAKGVRKTVMLTGDNPQIAEAVAEKLKIDEVYGGLLPQQKVERVEMLNGQKRKGGTLAFVGDGINDAPVLAMADIGVAMGGLGSDAAIEAADVVLMTDEPSKFLKAVDVAKYTRRIVWQNIVFALLVKALFLALGAFGLASLWEAVFADVGVALLAILNAMRVLRKTL